MNLGLSISETFFTSAQLNSSRFKTVHIADALRQLIIYKYGGFYLDLDYVVLNDLTHYKNIVVGKNM